MAGINNIKMKPKLIGAFLLVGVLPLAIIAMLSMNKAKDSMMKLSFNQLEAVQKIKKGQVKTFFDERVGDAQVLADNPYTSMAMLELGKTFATAKSKGLTGLRALQEREFKDAYDLYNSTFRYYMDTYGYYDVFLIDAEEGNVVYTVTQESDFGSTLSRENHHLTKTWKEAMRTGRPALSDMEAYAPSNGAPAMFVANPITDNGKTIGVLAFQISNSAINSIMQERAGMGKTGETYLVGSDKKMRSDSFLDPSGHSVEASFKGTVQANGVDTKATQNALAGRAGSEVIMDYNNNPVLSVYDPLDLNGVKWVVIAEIDLAEVEEPISALRSSVIVIGLVMAVIIGLFALWMSMNIANPIKRITSVAQVVAEGNLEENIATSCQLLSQEYLDQGDKRGSEEALRNVTLAKTQTVTIKDSFRKLCQLQDIWQKLMECTDKREVRLKILEIV